jgi:hypothetical protein
VEMPDTSRSSGQVQVAHRTAPAHPSHCPAAAAVPPIIDGNGRQDARRVTPPGSPMADSGVVSAKANRLTGSRVVAEPAAVCPR